MAQETLAPYALEADGAIHHWLACGPVTTSLNDLAQVVRANGSPFGPGQRWVINYVPASLSLKERVYRQLPCPEWHPGPRPALHEPGPWGQKNWQYVTALEDHLVDLSLFSFTPTWMDGWLFACLAAEEPLTVSAELLTVGPARVWLNGTLQAHHVGFGYVEPTVVPLPLSLSPGWNDLWLHGEMIGWREARMALGLRLRHRPPVTIGLALGGESVEAWQRAETALPDEYSLGQQFCPVDDTSFVDRHTVWIGDQDFCQHPYGEVEARRRQALDHLSQMPREVMGAVAAVETGRAERIAPEAVALACQFLENRCDCADFYALSLLVLLNRYGDHPALRLADQQRIEDAFQNFKFWLDEPGVDAMCHYTENHQILFHVTAYLAGQRWPDQVFLNSGRTGCWQKARAQRRIQDWILRRLRGGFSEWDSNSYLALDAFAMLALVEFAGSARLREMATTLLHKIFFMLACQSYRGVHGCTHGRAYVSALKTARVEETSGLQRIAWGLGTFNDETRATGLLALASRYRLPDVIQRIGADLPDLLLTRARSAGQYRPRFDLKRGTWEVNTLTRRTPDGMLSAAVDYCPGAPGWQEHVWQATLGPEAVVFTTHPGNSQEDEISRPNFWAGSARLPRVAMVDNTVICIYDLSLGGGLGFSHAYFPTMTFDEQVICGPWAFGRVGNGYVALGGDGDLQLTTVGRHAAQELRSCGPGQVWLCHVGRAAEDGDFATFCRQVGQHTPQVDRLSVRWTRPDRHTLAFDWEGPLLVDGQLQPLGPWPHYDNLYTHTPMGAEQMAIRHGDQQLILDLARGRVLS